METILQVRDLHTSFLTSNGEVITPSAPDRLANLARETT